MIMSSFRNILTSCTVVIVTTCCFLMIFSSYNAGNVIADVGVIGANEISSTVVIQIFTENNNTNEKDVSIAEKTKKCWGNVVTVIPGGRMCNYIFEYASVWGMGKMFGMRPYVPDKIRQKLDNVFIGLDVPPISELQNSQNCSHVDLQKSISSKDLFPLEKAVKESKDSDKPLVLWRWIVLLEVILPYAKELKDYFVFRPEIVAKSQKTLRNVYSLMKFNSPRQEMLFVGVHIRRTDYFSLLERHHVKAYAGVGYYQRAVAWMDSILRKNNKTENIVNIAYVVASDDDVWCKTVLIPQLKQDLNRRNATGKSDIFYAGIHDDPTHDLVLLSSCNHSIISYGTYGMWSALIAGGWTVYYDISVFNDNPDKIGPMKVAETLHNWRPLI